MNIAVIGCGYVGLVTGACLAATGNSVTCIDSDAQKVAQLRLGLLPFFEPGLEPLVQRHVRQRQLRFAAEPGPAIAAADLVFIAVGTPPLAHGDADVRQVLEVADVVGRHMAEGCIVACKSTVPVGTAERIKAAFDRAAKQRGLAPDHAVVANPEFLREGSAVQDFMSPDRVVIGLEDARAERVMRSVHAPFLEKPAQLLVMGLRDAELTKYAANAMLATRISFMNEMARLCDALGVDVEQLRRGIGADARIGQSYLHPGCGYGGSCFPKDVRALLAMGRAARTDLDLVAAVAHVNDLQKQWAAGVIASRFGHRLQGRRFAVWGLAFKPGTDDLREAPALALISDLLAAGGRVCAHDPAAMPRARRDWPQHWFDSGALQLAVSPLEAVDGADALVLMTEWALFSEPDFGEIRRRLRGSLIVDGRNRYDPARLRALGFDYAGVGRGAAAASATACAESTLAA